MRYKDFGNYTPKYLQIEGVNLESNWYFQQTNVEIEIAINFH